MYRAEAEALIGFIIQIARTGLLVVQACNGLTQLTALVLKQTSVFPEPAIDTDSALSLDNFAHVLSSMTGLARLELDWPWRVGDRCMDALCSLNQLTFLAVGKPWLWQTSGGYQDLSRLSQLRGCASTQRQYSGPYNVGNMSSEALKEALMHLANLNFLIISGWSFDMFGPLYSFSRLTKLAFLDYHCITQRHALSAKFAELTQLELLVITMSSHVDEQDMPHFDNCLLQLISGAFLIREVSDLPVYY